jgi:predicted transcriptional regulator
MMARKSKTLRRLARGELELLQMLWSAGPLSLSEAHRELDERIGYTTVQTRLNRLEQKRLARRSSDRPARYEASVTPAEVGASDLNLLVERVAGGSVVPLVAHLVRDRSLSPEELTELKQLIEEAERRQGQSRQQRG